MLVLTSSIIFANILADVLYAGRSKNKIRLISRKEGGIRDDNTSKQEWSILIKNGFSSRSLNIRRKANKKICY